MGAIELIHAVYPTMGRKQAFASPFLECSVKEFFRKTSSFAPAMVHISTAVRQHTVPGFLIVIVTCNELQGSGEDSVGSDFPATNFLHRRSTPSVEEKHRGLW
jgi:hypothetical protein